jgi:transposase InsO family protein
MPWKVSGVVEKRKQFVNEYAMGEWTMTDLCQAHGISRETGYEVLRRYRNHGEDGLEERSRAPHRHPNQMSPQLEEWILLLRREHMRWGPRKLKWVLERDRPGQVWPAASTIGELSAREGWVVARKKRRRVEPYATPFAAASEPNRVWWADFKGWFRSGDGRRIDPLTISDACSRYLLRCQAVEKADTLRVQAIFEAAFREYGMPWAIRSDNGAPFASRAIAGLSRLAVWWMKLGIVPERIAPGHPEQNGRHERMHRTMKQETAMPPASNRRTQQRAFDGFRREYNQQRPHEALGMKTPDSCYTVSARHYPARVREPEYDNAMLVRRVQQRGNFSWKHQDVFLSETLIGEHIGLRSVDERHYTVFFAQFPIARFDSQTLQIRRLPKQQDKDFYMDEAREGEPPPSPAPHPLTQPDLNMSTMSPV